MKLKLLIALLTALSLFIPFNRDQEDHVLLSEDKCGYYLYLPAVFIYHDLDKLSFFERVDHKYNGALGLKYSLHTVNGRKLDKYTAGVAIFELPFFIIANEYCRLYRGYDQDGFSKPYEIAMIFSNVFWSMLGLYVLGCFLLRHFSENAVLFSLVCIYAGTNLYAYTAFDIGMSHPISFLLFALFISLTDKLFTIRKMKYAWLMGLALGMVCLVRPVNGLIVVVPILWNIESKRDIYWRIKSIFRHWRWMLGMSLTFSIVIVLQLVYWKHITGNWLYYSYTGERFDLLHPQVINGLFSFRKGWFVYTPIALICLFGLYPLTRSYRGAVAAVAVFLVVMVYVVFSWWQWWYGGSFGCRPLIETFAVLSIPLAALLQRTLAMRKTLLKSSVLTLLAMLIALNIFQTYQYSMGLIHWDSMSKEYYLRVFGKIDFDRVENGRYLLKEGDSQK